LAEEDRASTKLFGLATNAFTGVTKSALGLGEALLTGQQNLSAYSGAIAKNTDLLGKNAKALGQLVNGLAKFAEGALAQYQVLTGTGATFGKEIGDIMIGAAELGLTVDEMTKFLQKNSESLRAFGGTTDLAISRFKAVSTTILDSAELGTELRRLGFTTADINENLALYGEISDANSRTDRRSVQEQARAAKALMVEMDGLSKLTGIQREELADEMRTRRRQGDVNAFLMGKSAEEQAAFTSQLTELQAKLGKDAADAFVDIALRGAPTTESTRGAVLAMGDGADQLYAAAQQFNRGDIGSFQDSLRAAATSAADFQNTEEFRQTAILGGLSQTSNAFADASEAAYNYKNAIDSVRDGTQTSASAEAELRNQINEEQLRQTQQTTGILDKTIGIQEDLREISTTVMKETIPRLESAATAALEKIAEVMPSADVLADKLGGAINQVFNAAEMEDHLSKIRSGNTSGFELLGNAAQQAEATANAIGLNTVAAINEDTVQTVEATKITTEQVEHAQNLLSDQNAELANATQRVEDMVAAGFNNTDPQLQAAKKAAEIAAERAAATERALTSLSHMQRTGSIRGFADGGTIKAGELALVGEAGPEFMVGNNVMSQNTSMGVMNNLMKSIRQLDDNVQNQTAETQNAISNNSDVTNIESMMSGKFDQMIAQLQQLVSIETSSVATQQRSLRATKGLQGNMLKGVV
jgi:hypothetical protein